MVWLVVIAGVSVDEGVLVCVDVAVLELDLELLAVALKELLDVSEVEMVIVAVPLSDLLAVRDVVGVFCREGYTSFRGGRVRGR